MRCRDAVAAGGVELDQVLQAPHTFHAADLQAVSKGTGEETYSIFMRQFASVGAPDWEQRCNASSTHPRRISTYLFGLDNGPDNKGATRRVKQRLKTSRNVMFSSAWCFMHQCQLIILNMLAMLDGWQWESEVDCDVKYFNAIAHIANAWRSTGVHSKMQRKSLAADHDELPGTVDKIPGRAIKGRWGAVDGIEAIIIAGGLLLVCLWKKLFGGETAAKPANVSSVGGDEAAQFEAEKRTQRIQSCKALTTRSFWMTLECSHVVKRPLMHFLRWAQKADGEYSTSLKEMADGMMYFGPTPLSKFTCGCALAIWNDMLFLLDDSALTSQSVFGPVFARIGAEERELRAETLLLILSILLPMICGWKFRMVDRVNWFPLMFLVLVEEGPQVACPLRKLVASRLLSESDELLGSAPHEDFTVKTKLMFLSDFRDMVMTGLCSVPLHVHLLLFRSKLPLDTQDIEGRNKHLQSLAGFSPLY